MKRYDKKIDKQNIITYSVYHTMDPLEERHTCVLCGMKTWISNSYSQQGHKLICQACFYKYFDADINKLVKWQLK